MTREEYKVKLAQLRKSPKYKEWKREQDDTIRRLKIDTEAIDPGDNEDEPVLD